MTDSEKQPFIQKWESMKATYVLEKEKYLGSLPPKRPASSFALYIKDITPTLRAENPGVKQDSLIKIASQNWKSLDKGLKSKYKELYETKLAEYKKSREII